MRKHLFSYPHVRDLVLELLRERYPKASSRIKVLDLGTGDGTFSKMAHDAGYAVQASDINWDYFGQKGRINWDYVDVNLPFKYKPDSFDAIVSIEVAEHSENVFNMFREVHRILKPGGIFIFSTPNVHNWYSKLLFLFRGGFSYFFRVGDWRGLHGEGLHHKTPIFSWLVREYLVKDRFIVQKTVYNDSVIPLLRLKVPMRGRLWGDTLVMRLQKKPLKKR